MSDIKPNVFPSQQVSEDKKIGQPQVSLAEQAAIDEMKRRTEEQLRLRAEAEAKNSAMADKYNANREAIMNQPKPQANNPSYTPQNTPVVPQQPSMGVMPPQRAYDPYIAQLSQPQMNTAFDVIPLPSEGKLYRNKKSSIKVAYMTTSDENILTSPNLLESGQFLEILMNRKILEPDLRYRDLHIGDRNAIMLWLRATGYGHMYPVTINDEKGVPFPVEIDLNEIKTIKLNVNPDAEGLFDFELPLTKTKIKFKLLMVGELEDLDALIDYEQKELKLPVNNRSTYALTKQLVEVNGSRDLNMIRDFASNMRVLDSQKLREYINKIESGVDLEITVRTPGGESIKTFLPLNLQFFWPNFGL